MYRSSSSTQQEIRDGLDDCYRLYGYVFDPHSIIAFLAARKAHSQGEEAPIVIVATAHPAKFVNTVEDSLRRAHADFTLPVPPQLAGIREKVTRCLQWSRGEDWADSWTRQLRDLIVHEHSRSQSASL